MSRRQRGNPFSGDAPSPGRATRQRRRPVLYVTGEQRAQRAIFREKLLHPTEDDLVRRAEAKIATPPVRSNQSLRQYGLTQTAFATMYLNQEGRCAICREVPERPLAIDHDHATGRVRGLLCFKCNGGLGLLGDDVEGLLAALRYLQPT